MTSLIFLLAISFAYSLGSLSFAIIVSKILQINDPRTFGSYNPGATNVLRSGNPLAAALTLFGDCLKGGIALWLASTSASALQLAPHITSLLIASVAIAVIIGHLWPIFFRFKGGKGVATTLGILLALHIWLGLSTLAVWLIALALFRISAVAALIAAIAGPLLAIYWLTDTLHIATVFIIAALVLRRHKKNILALI